MEMCDLLEYILWYGLIHQEFMFKYWPLTALECPH